VTHDEWVKATAGAERIGHERWSASGGWDGREVEVHRLSSGQFVLREERRHIDADGPRVTYELVTEEQARAALAGVRAEAAELEA
jgi:hypothetical protein